MTSTMPTKSANSKAPVNQMIGDRNGICDPVLELVISYYDIVREGVRLNRKYEDAQEEMPEEISDPKIHVDYVTRTYGSYEFRYYSAPIEVDWFIAGHANLSDAMLEDLRGIKQELERRFEQKRVLEEMLNINEFEKLMVKNEDTVSDLYRLLLETAATSQLGVLVKLLFAERWALIEDNRGITSVVATNSARNDLMRQLDEDWPLEGDFGNNIELFDTWLVKCLTKVFQIAGVQRLVPQIKMEKAH